VSPRDPISNEEFFASHGASWTPAPLAREVGPGPTWGIVVPTNRPERFAEFKEAWAQTLARDDVKGYVVHDDEDGWRDIPKFVPRRTDMIRSWGFYLAWRDGCQFIASLDDDVAPGEGDPLAAYERAFAKKWPFGPYLAVGALTDSGEQMRGFPYGGRWGQAGLQIGGWHGCPDLDAVTQLYREKAHSTFSATVLPVPQGSAVTTCAMNMAFRAELTPIMWQLPLLEGRYNRFGDIWAGLLAKRVLDGRGLVTLVNGEASVHHDRASNPYANIVKEAPGLEPNEGMWFRLVEDQDYGYVTDRFLYWFDDHDLDYADHFRRCRDEWLSLFR
jgi:hypothetical protein